MRRFSLRTLLLVVLLIGSGVGLWWRWEPWAKVASFEHVRGYTTDAPHCLIQVNSNDIKLVDIATQQVHAAVKVGDIPGTGLLLASRRYLLAGNSPCDFFIVDLQTQEKHHFKWFAEQSSTLALTPDGKRLLSTDPPIVYDLDAKKAVLQDDSAVPPARIYTPDKIFAAERERQAAIKVAHQCRTLQELHPLLGPALRVNLWFPPNAACVLTSVDFETVQVWNAATGQRLYSVNIGKGMREIGGFTCSASPSGRRLTVTTDGSFTIYDAATNACLLTRPANVRAVSDDAGERWLIFDSTGAAALHDLQAGRLLQTWPGNSPFATPQCDLSPDGLRVADRAQSVSVFVVDSGRKCMLPANDSSLNPFAPFGSRFFGNYLVVEKDGAQIFERRRHEDVIGILQLPELWLTMLFAWGLLVSLRGDFRSLRAKQKAEPAPLSPA